ncbi:MAG: DUF1629 domain-containing protein [Pseudomonadota bacterium]
MPYSFEMTSDVLEVGTPHFEPEISGATYRKLYSAEPLTEAEVRDLPRRVEISMHLDTSVTPDFINAAGPAVVSEQVHDKINALEPGRHRFVAIEMVRRTGGRARPYWFMLVTETVAHFDYDRTRWLTKLDAGFGPAAAEDSAYQLALGYNEPCVLKSDLIKGRHVWRGAPEGARKIFFCSDAFRDFAHANHLRGARFIPVGTA